MYILVFVYPVRSSRESDDPRRGRGIRAEASSQTFWHFETIFYSSLLVFLNDSSSAFVDGNKNDLSVSLFLKCILEEGENQSSLFLRNFSVTQLLRISSKNKNNLIILPSVVM